METTVKRLYEAMFLVDSARATDWDATTAAIKTILERVEAEIVVLRKWDERRLAYEINGKTRGTYILCYFRTDGGKIQQIEKMVQLSERIMRVLILSAETREEADIERDLAEPGSAAAEKETAAPRAEKPEQEAAEEKAEEAETTKAPAVDEKKQAYTKAEAEEPQESAEPAAEDMESEQPKDTEDLDLSDEQAGKEATED